MERTLAQWLEYQMQTHPKAIAMGLERVAAVAARLALGRPARCVMTVGGTNGKGSTVAFAEAIAREAGLRVGAFTSPHLLRYNERVRIDGRDVDDAVLVAAFERIEAARNAGGETIPLTYFEFGTLAAWLVFDDETLDLAILEVGLGGRLDAVNVIDADVTVITSVGIDHQEFLGADRETIGADKAGIMRAGRPCVLAERDPPSSVLQHAYRIGAFAIRAHADYLIEREGRRWTWREPGFEISLPLPALAAPVQIENAAAAIAALRALPIELPDRALVSGVRSARLPGRLQWISQSPPIVVDVAHNAQAAEQLARWLAENKAPTVAVFSALADKDIEAIVSLIDGHVERWYLAGISDAGPRGMSAAALAERLGTTLAAGRYEARDTVAEALAAARAALLPGRRILVFGSFHTVAAVLDTDPGTPERV